MTSFINYAEDENHSVFFCSAETELTLKFIFAELCISSTEAGNILELVLGRPSFQDDFPPSAFSLLQDEQLQQCVVTFSQRLDEVMGGGVPVAKITEICGVPGTGKTQLW